MERGGGRGEKGKEEATTVLKMKQWEGRKE